MKYKIGYQISKDGYLLGEVRVRENPRKKGDYPHSVNVIFISPPDVKKYKIRKWNGKEWIFESDFRRDWFDKTNGDPVIIHNIGEEIDLDQYIDKPLDGRFFFQYYNDIDNEWKENVVEKARVEKLHATKEIQKQLDALDVKKMRYLIEKDKGDLSGKQYFDEYEAETLKLRGELKEAVNGTE